MVDLLPGIEQKRVNLKLETGNWKHRTSNVQRRTFNIELRVLGHWITETTQVDVNDLEFGVEPSSRHRLPFSLDTGRPITKHTPAQTSTFDVRRSTFDVLPLSPSPPLPLTDSRTPSRIAP